MKTDISARVTGLNGQYNLTPVPGLSAEHPVVVPFLKICSMKSWKAPHGGESVNVYTYAWPEPVKSSLPGVQTSSALASGQVCNCVGVRPGFCCFPSAASPATCGD